MLGDCGSSPVAGGGVFPPRNRLVHVFKLGGVAVPAVSAVLAVLAVVAVIV